MKSFLLSIALMFFVGCASSGHYVFRSPQGRQCFYDSVSRLNQCKSACNQPNYSTTYLQNSTAQFGNSMCQIACNQQQRDELSSCPDLSYVTDEEQGSNSAKRDTASQPEKRIQTPLNPEQECEKMMKAGELKQGIDLNSCIEILNAT